MSRELSRSLVINTLWSFIGRFGYLGVSLVTNIILVRLLSPKEFGQVGIMMFFIVVATVLTESGLGGALIRKQNVKEVDYSTIFIFNLFVSILLMILLIASAGFIASFYQDDDLQDILIVSSVVLLINAFKLTQTTRLIKELQFKKKAAYEFVAVLLASASAIFLAYQGLGVWSLVALQLLTALILTVLLWVLVGPLKTYKFSKSSFKEFYKFGVNTTLASLLNTAFDNVYQLVLGKYFSITQTGYFYQAKKLQEMPTSIVQSIVLGPVYSALVKLQNKPKEFNNFYYEITKAYVVASGLLCLIIFFYSELIIVTLYGEQWVASAFYLKLLIASAFFYLQEMLNRIIFKVFNRTEQILRLELLKKSIQSITIIYGVWALSIESLLYGFFATSAISFFVNYFTARVAQNYFCWRDFWVPIKVIFVAVIIAFTGELSQAYLGLVGFEQLFLLPLIVVAYILLLIVFNVSNVFVDFKKFKYLMS